MRVSDRGIAGGGRAIISGRAPVVHQFIDALLQ